MFHSVKVAMVALVELEESESGASLLNWSASEHSPGAEEDREELHTTATAIMAPVGKVEQR
jgi:hypothetical protein